MQHTFQNLPLLYNINYSVMKNLVLRVKDKLLCHKNYFLTCICLVYLFTYVCHECARTWYVYMQFRVLLVISGLTMTMSLCLYPVLRFNKEDLFYLEFIPVGGCCTVIILNMAQSPYWVFGLIYVWIYLLMRDKTLLCNRLVVYFQRKMNWSWQSYILFNRLVIFLWREITFYWPSYFLFILF